MKIIAFVFFLALVSVADSHDGPSNVKKRRGRIFSLFNVVTFKNEPCSGSSSTSGNSVQGVCLSASECENKGNSNADGNCAAGFGVCCVFSISGCTNTVSENCTYVQNPGYPNQYTTTGTTCTTTITRPSSCRLCQIRLDFENFSTMVLNTGACDDTFVVAAPFSTNTQAFPPGVCGTLTGQHMYYETGMMGNPTFTLTTSNTAGNRAWRIKVTMIECSNQLRAPAGCAQYFTGATGVVETYNFNGNQLLQSQNYNDCVRQEAGFCSIRWFENPAATDAFLLSAPPTATQTTCIAVNAMLFINSIFPTGLCGGVFGTIVTETTPAAVTSTAAPFTIGLRTLAATQAGLTGYSLAYSQLPC